MTSSSVDSVPSADPAIGIRPVARTDDVDAENLAVFAAGDDILTSPSAPMIRLLPLAPRGIVQRGSRSAGLSLAVR